MTTLEYALDYIKRGWSVIPLEPGSKAPATGLPLYDHLSGEERFGTASAQAWWGGGPTPWGIGIITGRPSGLIVADIDPRNQGADPGDPGPRVRTGGGGIHIYFNLPPDMPEPRCGPSSRPGIDRKAGGGYVVAPPSVHPNGGAYVWVTYERP